MTSVSRTLCLGVAVLFLVVTGCDSTTEDTIILNDPANPTEASFEFTYTEDDWSNGAVDVSSQGADDLGDILSVYGYSRGDITSARVAGVTLVRISSAAAQQQAGPRPKVFSYINSIDVRIGGASGPIVAQLQPVPFDDEVELGLTQNTDVTSLLKSGPVGAFITLGVDNPSSIGGSSDVQDRVEIDVTYRIEVQGI